MNANLMTMTVEQLETTLETLESEMYGPAGSNRRQRIRQAELKVEIEKRKLERLMRSNY